MALKRVALEIGMGTDIRGRDYTKAAVRALRDRVSAMELEHTRTVAGALDATAPSADALDAAKQAVIAWKYLRRFLEEADALES